MEYDEETGLPTEKSAELKIQSDLNRVLTQSQHFNELKLTKGWALLDRFIDGQVVHLTNLLKVEKDFNKIIRIQAELLAFESLNQIIEKSFEDAEDARRRILDFIEATPQDNFN